MNALSVAAALAAVLHAAEPAAPVTAPPATAAERDASSAIQKAMERELAPLAPQPFATPSGIQGSVEAATAPGVKVADGAEELAISLGTEQALSCTLFASRVDVAATTWRVVESVKKNLKLLIVRPVEVSAVAGSVLVISELVYQTTTDKGPMVGQLKLAIYAHDGHSFLCLHDEPGYNKTFARAVKGLATSLRGGGEDGRAGARFAELSVMRIAGTPIGYSEHLLWDRKGGGRVSTAYSAQLLPRGPADLVAIDAYSEEEIDAKDLLASGSYAHVTNGETDTKIRLTRGKDGRTFRYEGEKEGKPLRGKFSTKAGLSTDLWFARRFAAAAKAPRGDLRHEAYSFEANPVAALPIVYRKDPAGPRRARMELGPIRIAGELDASGLFQTGEMPIGPTKLVIERAWSRGTP
jgi:hypothetical protein